ncbi:MAG: 30S ribosome-binding factor RbfA [Candidatus Hydrogenedentes bacterium]|nr:30S ribosome-binding factor RbfA [Candidatus Hydrogenedentota bacterium]
MRENRLKRVGELIREEIAALLTKGVKDPRVGFVSVLAVRVSSDLRYANVYVSLYGKENERKSSLIALKNSAGWIRRELGKTVRLRFTPELRFFEDDTLDRVFHMEEVFREIHEEQEGDKNAGK